MQSMNFRTIDLGFHRIQAYDLRNNRTPSQREALQFSGRQFELWAGGIRRHQTLYRVKSSKVSIRLFCSNLTCLFCANCIHPSEFARKVVFWRTKSKRSMKKSSHKECLASQNNHCSRSAICRTQRLRPESNTKIIPSSPQKEEII